MNKIINLTPDYLETLDNMEKKIITDKLGSGPKGTRIIMKDSDTGEVLGDYHNKILVTGSILSGMNAFKCDPPIMLPSYNTELGLDHTLDYKSVERKNDPYVCLFCIGDSGCGSLAKDVFKVSYSDRIEPKDDILPFRYVHYKKDINDDLRKYYFGRKKHDNDMVAYYFKSFETLPQMHIRYTDGTQVNEEMYSIETTQSIEVYVQTKLKVTRNDFRDYFEQVRGWDNARISTLSLCWAWYDDSIDEYKWYQQIYPYSKLNFSTEWLVDLTKAIEFHYQVFY